MAMQVVGRERRKLRIRRKISGTAERPRVTVFRSLKHIRFEALRLAPCRVVPVLIAVEGVDTQFFTTACTLDFAAVMLDTQRKNAGSLIAQLGQPRLAALRDLAARHDCPLGLAGALRLDDLPAIAELAPDFAGFRSAVCTGDRTGQHDARRVRGLREELRRLTALMA